jgi:hypothetical protein
MNVCALFDTEAEARAFAAGLEYVNDGEIAINAFEDRENCTAVIFDDQNADSQSLDFRHSVLMPQPTMQ